MREAVKIVGMVALGLVAVFAHERPANATTLNVPDGESNYDFSVMTSGTSGPGSLGFGPLVDVFNNGCPGVACQLSFWEDSFTVTMFNQMGSLLATDTRSTEEICSPSGCSAPTVAFVAMVADTSYFELSNDVGVGGGWTFNSASITIANGGDFQISETPIPATLPLLVTGIGGLVISGWHKNRKRKRSARQEVER